MSKVVPVAALIASGGKSIHAWIRVDCTDRKEWKELVKGRLYRDVFIPLGADPACSNPSRKSRLPGVVRPGGGWQEILFLNPQGGSVQ